jgi:hypothetical protein
MKTFAERYDEFFEMTHGDQEGHEDCYEEIKKMFYAGAYEALVHCYEDPAHDTQALTKELHEFAESMRDQDSEEPPIHVSH